MLSRVSDFPPQVPGDGDAYEYGRMYENGINSVNQMAGNPPDGVQQRIYPGYDDYSVQCPCEPGSDYPEIKTDVECRMRPVVRRYGYSD